MRGMTMFSGGGGVEALLKDDIDFVAAIEYDAAIADVYRANIGDHVIVGDVCDVDYTQFGRIDYLHASPVCKNASQAKTNGTESDIDIQTAEAVGRALRTLQPRTFTLENVGGYQRFDAYRRICRTLDALGYMWHAEVLNAADYGVPQTRRRLILRAVKDALLPGLPQPQPWIGWYAAIEDLIPTLPASQFAPWQLARLPQYSSDSFLQPWDTTGHAKRKWEPSATITTQARGRYYAFLVDGANVGRVVKMTPRALARFQSVPDWYALPERINFASTVIGNMVPPLLMREVVMPLL